MKEGTFLHAAFPAPSVLGNFVMNDVIAETVMKALAAAAPDRVCAGWGRGLNVSLYGTDPATGTEFLAVPLLSNKCGAGGVAGVDGQDCIGILTCGGGFAFDDYEVFEAGLPITLLGHEYWEDSAGPGTWRGGLGIRVAYRMEAEDADHVLRRRQRRALRPLRRRARDREPHGRDPTGRRTVRTSAQLHHVGCARVDPRDVQPPVAGAMDRPQRARAPWSTAICETG